MHNESLSFQHEATWCDACNGNGHDSTQYATIEGAGIRGRFARCDESGNPLAQNLQEAATRLREQTYSAAVIDQFLLEAEPEESDQVLEHFGTAFPVYVNFALTGMERLLREVCSALHRRKREESAARRAVAEQMQSDSDGSTRYSKSGLPRRYVPSIILPAS
jgi:hypothetical protein